MFFFLFHAYNVFEVSGERKLEDEEKIRQALLKKALGYESDEIVEEYSFDEGDLKLSKKKVTKKHYSPDISAVKVLLERYYKTYEEVISSMSDEELASERDKLEKLLKGEENGN